MSLMSIFATSKELKISRRWENKWKQLQYCNQDRLANKQVLEQGCEKKEGSGKLEKTVFFHQMFVPLAFICGKEGIFGEGALRVQAKTRNQKHWKLWKFFLERNRWVAGSSKHGSSENTNRGVWCVFLLEAETIKPSLAKIWTVKRSSICVGFSFPNILTVPPWKNILNTGRHSMFLLFGPFYNS